MDDSLQHMTRKLHLAYRWQVPRLTEVSRNDFNASLIFGHHDYLD